MERTTLQNWNVLSDLLTDFTDAYNSGRAANDARYEDILTAFQDVLDKHQTEVQTFQDDTMDDASVGHVTLMVSTITSLETDYDALSSDLDSYDSGDRETELTALKTAWSTAATDLATEYNNTTGDLDLSTIISEVDDAIDDLDTAVTDFNTAFDGLRATLVSDFTTHQGLTRGYLTGLGTTELARINERFANDLAVQKQQLIDRGLYSSWLVTDITARNTREKNEAIAELNDRLNREKVANEHALYGQQFQMRLGGLDVSMKAIDGAAKVVSARLQHGQWSGEIRHKLMGLTINTKLALLGVREKYYQALLQSIDWESDRRRALYRDLMEVRQRQFELRHRVAGMESELLRWQLDSRNNLAAALFGFVERRTDSYPDLGSLAQLTASLAETGAATWQST
jgi:hypothetical protein